MKVKYKIKKRERGTMEKGEKGNEKRMKLETRN
jgi:hypothetical protein